MDAGILALLGVARACQPDRGLRGHRTCPHGGSNGTTIQPRSELLLFGEGARFSLEHVTRINPEAVRERARNSGLQNPGDWPANVPQHSGSRESCPSHSNPDDGSCLSDAACLVQACTARAGHSARALLSFADFSQKGPTVFKKVLPR